MQDYIDHLLMQWQAVAPDHDVETMAVFARLSRASRLVEKSIEGVFAKHGLDGGKFDVLAALRRSGPPHVLSPTSLYNSLLITSGAMTHRLEHLRDAGLVERLPNPDDGRGSLVRLTDKGLQILDRALAEHLENERRLLHDFDIEERDQLAALLRRLLVALDDTGEPSNSLPFEGLNRT